MGYTCSWVAVQGASKEALLEALDLVETGEEVQPGCGVEGLISLGETPDGWVVLFSEDFDWGDPDRVGDLSRFGAAVGCQFEDRVEMHSLACGAQAGRELWRIFHKNDPVYRLDVTGEPPPGFAAIRNRLFSEQEADGGAKSSTDFIFDIPIRVAESVCGFVHDEAHEPFVALKSAGASAPHPAPAPKPSVLGWMRAALAPRKSGQP
jgi:hypothetical protein